MSGGPLDHAYQLEQLHFHWGAEDSRGSEHTVDGRRFPMEMHLVHHRHHYHKHKENDEEAIAVLGVFFEISEVVTKYHNTKRHKIKDSDHFIYTYCYLQDDNEELQPLFDKLHKVKEFCSEHKHHYRQFSVAALLASLDTATFASYTGSFTTPPCSEQVQWVSFLRPLTVSSSQLAQLRSGQGHSWHSVHSLL